jgi:hypothetical protein
MLIIGLLLVVVAGVVGSVGILSNRGTGHQVSGGFDALGYTMHGPTGQLFFWGIIVGCIAMLGLVLIVGGLRSGLKRRGTARRNASWRKKSEKEAQPAAEPVAPELVEALPETVPESASESVQAPPAVEKVGG